MLDSEYVYIAGGITIVLVVVLIAQFAKKTAIAYQNDERVAVKTSKGVIKLNQQKLAEELSKILAELSKHVGCGRSTKFGDQIDNLLADLKEFVNKNPGANLAEGDIRGNIIHRKLSDLNTVDKLQYNAAYQAILSSDDLDYADDEAKFDYLLKHIDILIEMLRANICGEGIVDLDRLENLLREMDEDLSGGTGSFRSVAGFNMMHSPDPYMNTRATWIESKQSQMEGFSQEIAPHRKAPEEQNLILGAQNARNAQQRSNMFRVNRQILGDKQYNDEDMLLDMNQDYAEL